MKRLYLYLSMLVFLLFTSCRLDGEIGVNPDLQSGEYMFSVTLPEPMEVLSRTMGDVVDLDGKELHVLVFDKNGFFVANQTASSVNQSNGKYTYKVKLPPSKETRTLHFILGNVKYPVFVPDDSEAGIFSKLSVSDGEDAYWQRVTVNNIMENMTLGNIVLIRNFAKISVESSVADFNYKGFAVVRSTNAGTVAPYVGPEKTDNGGFADFAGVTDYATFVSQNNGYKGNTAGYILDNVPQEFTVNSKYVYERNQDKAQRPTYILIEAEYDNTLCYYKLDIVSTDEKTWITSYLNLYRNFHYKIKITSVKGAGYPTPEAAMQATASNNIGASVEVSQVNTIQDGHGNELWVSTLDTLIVTANSANIYYRYKTGMNSDGSGGTVSNEHVKITPVSEGEGGENDKAISSWKASDGVLTITPASLPQLMETQEFVLATNSGLSRRVVVRVRQPFKMRVDCDDPIEYEIGASQVLRVILPPNMPTAVFPLTLDIESERKTLYPDVDKNRIPVYSDGNQTFSYKAVVSYADYKSSSTCHFYFLTNEAYSATSITVTNPYFENVDNVASFINEGVGRFGFGVVTVNDEAESYLFDTYETHEASLVLKFNLHNEVDDFKPTEHPVFIFPSDPERFDLDATTSSTGKVTITDGRYITYIPDNVYERQVVTFKSQVDFITGTFQLSAYDHNTETISYGVKPLEIITRYGYYNWRGQWTEYNVNGEIQIYNNGDYVGLPIYSARASNGNYTIDSKIFGGANMGDIWYFRYKEGFINKTNYDCSVELKDLISSKSILLKEEK